MKFNFLIAIKKGKDHINMLKYLSPIAEEIIITSFFIDKQDLICLSEDTHEIASSRKKLNFYNIRVIEKPEITLEYILNRPNKLVMITGSLYLIGELYPLFRNYFESDMKFVSQ